MIEANIGKEKFAVEEIDGKFKVNGKPMPWDLVKISEHQYHVLLNHRSYSLELVKKDEQAKVLSIKINGQLVEVQLKDKMDLLLEKLGLAEMASQKLKDLKAPMPGLVLDILVEVGQQVEKGDKIIVLEAMKMENVLKAEGEGEISTIKVKKGQGVEKNQVMIEFKS